MPAPPAALGAAASCASLTWKILLQRFFLLVTLALSFSLSLTSYSSPNSLSGLAWPFFSFSYS
jgi:hypothetical protein